MKKIGIIGAGISGLFIANLFKENHKYQVTIFEKKHSVELEEGYGIQLSTNSIKLLNKIGFNEIEKREKFNPEKIDFYEIKNQKKISDLNISEYNSEDCKYTTMKRSILVEFLKNRLDEQVIKYEHSIEKIEKKHDQINLTFNNNQSFICDYLIISDGIFSKGKSLISNNHIQPTYNNCIAIRGKIPRANLISLNEMNISLFVSSGTSLICSVVSTLTALAPALKARDAASSLAALRALSNASSIMSKSAGPCGRCTRNLPSVGWVTVIITRWHTDPTAAPTAPATCLLYTSPSPRDS